MDRTKDWLKYSGELLEIAALLKENAKYSWSCFTYQQASVAALKAIISKMGESTCGDNLIALLRSVKTKKNPPKEVEQACHEINGYFKSCRDLESKPEGTPPNNHTEEDAKKAKHAAKLILRYAHHESH